MACQDATLTSTTLLVASHIATCRQASTFINHPATISNPAASHTIYGSATIRYLQAAPGSQSTPGAGCQTCVQATRRDKHNQHRLSAWVCLFLVPACLRVNRSLSLKSLLNIQLQLPLHTNLAPHLLTPCHTTPLMSAHLCRLSSSAAASSSFRASGSQSLQHAR